MLSKMLQVNLSDCKLKTVSECFLKFCRHTYFAENHLNAFSFHPASAKNVPEPQIDIISSLCGSSVAWFYMMIEGASDGAVKVGLPRKLATELAARAMVGAGNMVLKTGKHPGEVRLKSLANPVC